jgi:hypothetical protein
MENLIFTVAMAITLHTSPANYNWKHPHFRIQSEQMIAGVYYNSMRNPSAYLARRFEYGRAWIDAGGVTGYRYPVIPMVVFGYSLSKNASVFFSPVLDDHGLSGLAAIQINFSTGGGR